jgi:hypothetical protein
VQNEVPQYLQPYSKTNLTHQALLLDEVESKGIPLYAGYGKIVAARTLISVNLKAHGIMLGIGSVDNIIDHHLNAWKKRNEESGDASGENSEQTTVEIDRKCDDIWTVKEMEMARKEGNAAASANDAAIAAQLMAVSNQQRDAACAGMGHTSAAGTVAAGSASLPRRAS